MVGDLKVGETMVVYPLMVKQMEHHQTTMMLMVVLLMAALV
jgi:hypothetical protein